MALTIDTPTAPWADQSLTLGGKKYTFTYSYNERDSRWRLDISLAGAAVISGVKVMENQFLLGRYILPDFDHGDIVCVRFEDDGNPVGRDNLGLGKPYVLQYYTNDELALLEG
jgi:hypothetical protein